MVYILLKHRVKNFSDWKPYFDNDYASRKEYGIEVRKLFRKIDDPDEVQILFTAPSVDKVNMMIHRPELKELMLKAGEISEPEISVLVLVQ